MHKIIQNLTTWKVGFAFLTFPGGQVSPEVRSFRLRFSKEADMTCEADEPDILTWSEAEQQRRQTDMTINSFCAHTIIIIISTFAPIKKHQNCELPNLLYKTGLLGSPSN